MLPLREYEHEEVRVNIVLASARAIENISGLFEEDRRRAQARLAHDSCCTGMNPIERRRLPPYRRLSQ